MFVILRHPWFFPLVDPSTLGRKTLYELASLVHCYNAGSTYSIVIPRRQANHKLSPDEIMLSRAHLSSEGCVIPDSCHQRDIHPTFYSEIIL